MRVQRVSSLGVVCRPSLALGERRRFGGEGGKARWSWTAREPIKRAHIKHETFSTSQRLLPSESFQLDNQTMQDESSTER